MSKAHRELNRLFIKVLLVVYLGNLLVGIYRGKDLINIHLSMIIICFIVFSTTWAMNKIVESMYEKSKDGDKDE